MPLSIFSPKSLFPPTADARVLSQSRAASRNSPVCALAPGRALNMLVARMLPRSGSLDYSSILWLKAPFAAKTAMGIFEVDNDFERGRVRKSKPVEKPLTIRQLSELIQISRSTLYEWTRSGFIPPYKFPKGVKFKASEIENWLGKRKRKGRSQHRLNIGFLTDNTSPITP